MKSVRKPVQNHPIMNSLLRYRELLCDQSERYETIILPQIEKILSNINLLSSKASTKKSKKLLNILIKPPVQQAVKIPRSQKNNSETANDIELNEFDGYEDEDDDNDDDDNGTTEITEDPMVTADAKRGITYQISKNKGLTPRRKKELKNPRVKNRMKYRKAKIRRKGQIREPRKEVRRYDGEISGIKVNLSKSIKIKA